MPKADYPTGVLDPIINAMKSTIARNGGCMNMAGYCRRGNLLLTVLYDYPGSDDDPEPFKEPITVVLGRIGRAVQADLVITVQDTYYLDSSMSTMAVEPEWDDIPGGRPSEDPDLIEVLWVLGYRANGSPLPPSCLPYGRDDQGRPVWQEWDSLPLPDLEAMIPDAWRKGLTDPIRPLHLLVQSLGSLLGMPMPSMFVFDKAVAARLGGRAE